MKQIIDLRNLKLAADTAWITMAAVFLYILVIIP